MKDLSTLVKELELSSLYRFKDHRNPNYTFMVLYVSPDDYHTFVGFKMNLDEKKKETLIVAEVGNFYMNKGKTELFMDTPETNIDVSKKEYQAFYKKNSDLPVFQKSYLSLFDTLSSI